MTRDEAIAVVKAARIRPELLEAIAFLVETTEEEGDYAYGGVDEGSYWVSSTQATLDSAAEMIRQFGGTAP